MFEPQVKLGPQETTVVKMVPQFCRPTKTWPMVAILHMFTWCKYEAKLPNGHPIFAGLSSL
jgi:hypothetical protein